MPTSIFVSYSHQDMDLVQPVVQLLRVGEAVVFHDVDSIAPGRQWRREIEEALSAAQLVIVFWCSHAAESTEVRSEYRWALAIGTNVLPVLLDWTPLPAPLHAFQWLSFQHLATGTHGEEVRQSLRRETRINGGRAGDMHDRDEPPNVQQAMAAQLRAELVRRGMGSA